MVGQGDFNEGQGEENGRKVSERRCIVVEEHR